MTALPYEVVPEECGRFETVGASEGYYLLGDLIELPPWACPKKLLQSKAYRGAWDAWDSHEDDRDHAMYWGSKLEDDILAAVNDGMAVWGFTGDPVELVVEPWGSKQLRSTRHPRVGASPDGRVLNMDRTLFEAKNPNMFAKKHWKAGPDLPYQVQGVQQLEVTEYDAVIFGVLFGNRGKVHCWKVKRHERMQRLLVERINQFWARVEDARKQAEAA